MRPPVNNPSPVITAMYCLPFTAYVMVLFWMVPPSVVSQTISPLWAWNALNF